MQVVDEPTYLLSRFLPANIMHCIHDDLIPLYHTMVESRQRRSPQSPSEPDVTSTYVVVLAPNPAKEQRAHSPY